MAIQDSSPERRNLLLISLSFIVFILGGASTPTDEVRLQVISVSFSRPEVLIVIAWLLFFWFLYRYWVVNRSVFSKEFREEINRMRDKRFFRSFIEDSIGHPLAPQVAVKQPKETGMIIEWLRWHEGCLKAFVMEKALNRQDLGSIQGQGPVDGGLRETVSLSGFKGWSVALRLVVACIIEQPSFSSYIAPYFLALFAIVLGVNEYVL
ncbi:hypothetical protein QWI17_20560 [Gilvimarinus sp. SDUM040013]|uniref:Uncharacterized protein n=1 Tax=Gilvimarinus gilvus TaxID=3058038 RepID=A0ABU4RSD9_9GAMM|nr:hypothetical protein [Gilvimarinus sp. SDUM040013]MDO3388251.1 hypothetical protein [Gilvimarinus sp. SDUM040013]MDX6847801.1 hypothetical protein [Gilvimarinus sp. SDUM040013]